MFEWGGEERSAQNQRFLSVSKEKKLFIFNHFLNVKPMNPPCSLIFFLWFFLYMILLWNTYLKFRWVVFKRKTNILCKYFKRTLFFCALKLYDDLIANFMILYESVYDLTIWVFQIRVQAIFQNTHIVLLYVWYWRTLWQLR